MSCPTDSEHDGPARVVLVTGGSGGIGRAICGEFARARWRIGVHYRARRGEAERVTAEVARHGGEGVPVHADIRRADQVEQMVRTVLDRWGRLDALICSAGYARGRLLMQTADDEWDAVIGTNLTGPFLCMKAAAESMLARRRGAIVVVGSFAGSQGRPGQAAYAASKAGLLGLMKSAAREWGASNVRVNAVLPGWHRTAMTLGALPARDELDDHVLGRSPAVQEVARTIYHLAQREDVSGQVWNLDSRLL